MMLGWADKLEIWRQEANEEAKRKAQTSSLPHALK